MRSRVILMAGGPVWSRLAARMIVLRGAPVYVQPFIGGTDCMAEVQAKGVLYSKLILSTRLG